MPRSAGRRRNSCSGYGVAPPMISKFWRRSSRGSLAGSRPVILRSAWADVRRTWFRAMLVASSVGSARSSLAPTWSFTAPLGPTFVGHGFDQLVASSLGSARSSLAPTCGFSAPLGPTFVGHGFSTQLVASSLGSARSSLAPTCVSPLRLGRRSSDMATADVGRLVPRLRPLVPRSYLRFCTALSHRVVGKQQNGSGFGNPEATAIRSALIA